MTPQMSTQLQQEPRDEDRSRTGDEVRFVWGKVCCLRYSGKKHLLMTFLQPLTESGQEEGNEELIGHQVCVGGWVADCLFSGGFRGGFRSFN